MAIEKILTDDQVSSYSLILTIQNNKTRCKALSQQMD